jgi:hypothetical protein
MGGFKFEDYLTQSEKEPAAAWNYRSTEKHVILNKT